MTSSPVTRPVLFFNQDSDENTLPQHSGLSGITKVAEALGGFGIGMTEYMALLIIDALSKALGLDTKGKSLKEIFQKLNTALDDPQFRDVLVLVMRSLSQVLLIFIDELKPPLKELIQESIDLGATSLNKLAKSLVAESIDALGVVPGVGEVVEGVKLLDDVVKQIQAAIGVVLKSVTLFTSFLESGLDSFTTIKESVDNAVNTVNAAVNSIPTMENMERLAKERAGHYLDSKIADAQSAVQNKVQGAVQGAVQGVTQGAVQGLQNATKNVAAKNLEAKNAAALQTGGMKLLKKNNMERSNRIRKTIKIFLDRNKSTSSTRRRKDF
jgi:hypothetical protein